MPTLLQTAVALTGAVQHLENTNVKPGSTRASVSMTELSGSVGGVYNHLTAAAAADRQAVADTLTDATAKLQEASANAKAAKAAIATADGAKAKAAAELDFAKATAAESVAQAVFGSAAAHAKASEPSDLLEDEAANLQAKAEECRNKSDNLKREGDAAVVTIQEHADRFIQEATEAYKTRMTEIEAEVKKALGV